MSTLFLFFPIRAENPMSNLTLLKCLVAVSMVLTLQPAHSGDGELSPSPYHVYDPTTGFTVPVDEQQQSLHDADAAINAHAQESGSSTGHETGATQYPAPRSEEPRAMSYLWLLGIFLVVGVLAAILRMRSIRTGSSSALPRGRPVQ